MAKEKSILVFIMVLLLVFLEGAFAATYSGGTGDPNNPYLIATAEDMNSIGAHPNDWDKHFLLMADVNLAAYTGTQFNIIGISYANAFTGVFDGNGHTISNFTYTSTGTNSIGLFKCVGSAGDKGKVEDLGLLNPNVQGGTGIWVGSLVGKLGNGIIRGCYVIGGAISGYECVGGLVGDNTSAGEISNCYSDTNVRGTGEYWVGGLVGLNEYGDILSCYSKSIVSGMGLVGGLVGMNNRGDICKCYSLAYVSAEYRAGGLVGENYEGNILNCYSNASTSGTDDVGGLVGWHRGSVSNCYSTGSAIGERNIGGLIGNISRANVSNCYATGAVRGCDCIGGLVGLNSVGTVSNSYTVAIVEGNDQNVGGLAGHDKYELGSYTGCFWNTDINTGANGIGNRTEPNVIGESTVNMQTKSTFTDAGWDFVEIWNIGENQTYPFLRSHPPGDINNDDIVNFFDLAILGRHWLQSTQ